MTCICNPYAEPNAERAPNCPVHGKADLRKQYECSGGGGFGSCRDQRDSELCANCEAFVTMRTEKDTEAADLRKQVEELLAPHWISGRPREFAIVDAFPAIARHYLALLAERESAQAYILALRQMLYSNNPRFDVNDLAIALEDLRQRTEEAGLALMDKQHADAKADAEIEEMWRQRVTQLEAENAALRKSSALATQHYAENERLREVEKMARKFAAYTQVLEVLAAEDKKLGSTNGWGDLDFVLGARGQVLTMGDFRLLAAALSLADAKEKP